MRAWRRLAGLSAQTMGAGRQTLARLCCAKATGTVHAAAAAAAVTARGGCSAASTVHCSASNNAMGRCFFARQATPAAAGWTQAGMPPALARTLRVHVLFPFRAMSSPASGSAGSADKTDKVKHEVSPRRVSSNLNQT
jgi:hypothetical protein